MKLLLPIFLFSFLSLVGLETRAYAEQDTIIKNTNVVAPEYKADFVISGDNPNPRIDIFNFMDYNVDILDQQKSRAYQWKQIFEKDKIKNKTKPNESSEN